LWGCAVPGKGYPVVNNLAKEPEASGHSLLNLVLKEHPSFLFLYIFLRESCTDTWIRSTTLLLQKFDKILGPSLELFSLLGCLLGIDVGCEASDEHLEASLLHLFTKLKKVLSCITGTATTCGTW
jgi:hypothetical protein